MLSLNRVAALSHEVPFPKASWRFATGGYARKICYVICYGAKKSPPIGGPRGGCLNAGRLQRTCNATSACPTADCGRFHPATTSNRLLLHRWEGARSALFTGISSRRLGRQQSSAKNCIYQL